MMVLRFPDCTSRPQFPVLSSGQSKLRGVGRYLPLTRSSTLGARLPKSSRYMSKARLIWWRLTMQIAVRDFFLADATAVISSEASTARTAMTVNSSTSVNAAARRAPTAAGRNLCSPSPREERTGRGVSELGQQPSSPRLRGRSHFGAAKARPSPPLVYIFSVGFTSVAAAILAAVEGGILPPGSEVRIGRGFPNHTPIPPARMPGSTAGKMPAVTLNRCPLVGGAGAVVLPQRWLNSMAV